MLIHEKKVLLQSESRQTIRYPGKAEKLSIDVIKDKSLNTLDVKL